MRHAVHRSLSLITAGSTPVRSVASSTRSLRYLRRNEERRRRVRCTDFRATAAVRSTCAAACASAVAQLTLRGRDGTQLPCSPHVGRQPRRAEAMDDSPRARPGEPTGLLRTELRAQRRDAISAWSALRAGMSCRGCRCQHRRASGTRVRSRVALAVARWGDRVGRGHGRPAPERHTYAVAKLDHACAVGP